VDFLSVKHSEKIKLIRKVIKRYYPKTSVVTGEDGSVIVSELYAGSSSLVIRRLRGKKVGAKVIIPKDLVDYAWYDALDFIRDWIVEEYASKKPRLHLPTLKYIYARVRDLTENYGMVEPLGDLLEILEEDIPLEEGFIK
jgi:hypothetical protein